MGFLAGEKGMAAAGSGTAGTGAGAGAGAGEQIQLARLARHGRKAAVLLHIEAFLGLEAPGREHLGKAHALVLKLLQVLLAGAFRLA